MSSSVGGPPSTFPALAPRESLCARLKKPVLQHTADGFNALKSKLLAPLGGPPRVSTASSAKGNEVALILPVVPGTESAASTSLSFALGYTSTRKLGRWPHKEERRPPIPRLTAQRRIEQQRQQWQHALTDGSSQFSQSAASTMSRGVSWRAPSPVTLCEAAYTKDLLGGGICRFNLDAEIDARCGEFASMASYRLESSSEAAQRDREKAALWRRRRDDTDTLAKIRWNLRSALPDKPPSPPPREVCPLPPSIDRGEWEPEEGELDLLSRPCSPFSDEVSKRLKRQRHKGFKSTQLALLADELEEEEDEEARSDEDDELDNKRDPFSEVFLQRMESKAHRLSERRREKIDRRRREALEKKRQNEAEADHAEHEMEELLAAMEKEDQTQKQDHYSHIGIGEVTDFLSVLRMKEVEAYEVVFRQFDDETTETVDLAELRKLLAACGLRPRNAHERDAVSEVLEPIDSLEVDFNFVTSRVIPPVRVKLADLRRPQLLGLFKSADEDNSGTLSVMELLGILHRSGFYPTMTEVSDAVMEVVPELGDEMYNLDGSVLLDRNMITLPVFFILAPLLQERAEYSRNQMRIQIGEDLSLDEEMKELWEDGLVDVRDQFTRRLEPHQTHIHEDLLPYVMSDTDIIPKEADVRELLKELVQEHFKALGEDKPRTEGRYVDLAGCIQILSKIRALEVERVREVFKMNDADGTNGLCIEECMSCLNIVGIRPQTEKEKKRLANLIDEYDQDGSGELELAEFMGMVKFVAERLRKTRLRIQHDKATSYGWKQEEFEQIRTEFMNVDDNLDGYINEAQVAQALQTLRPDWPAADTNAFLKEMKLMSWNSTAHVELLELLNVLKNIDRRILHRKIGASLGLDKDAADNFARTWLTMNPSDSDTVTAKVLAKSLKAFPGYATKLTRIQELIQQGYTDVPFDKFVFVMRRTWEPTPSKVDGQEDTLHLTAVATATGPEIPIEQPRKRFEDRIASGLGKLF